jgi:NADPH2:quinone reductase
MKAVQLQNFGVTSELLPRDVPDPVPSKGEVLIKVEAAGVNPSDAKNFEGRMRQTRLPRVLGRDFAGTVLQGSATWVGKKVWGTGGDVGFTRDGSFAQRLVVPESALLEIPSGWTLTQIATVALPLLTAWEALKRLTFSWPGESLLIVGGTGAVGSCAAYLAMLREAKVLRTTRHGSGGAPGQWIDLTMGPLNEQVLKVTEGKGVGHIFNTVGGDTFQPSLASLAKGGKMVSIASAPPEVTFNLVDFYHKQLTLIGVDTLALDARASAASLREIIFDLQAPEFKSLPAQSYPLNCALQAFEHKGKAVLLPNG